PVPGPPLSPRTRRSLSLEDGRQAVPADLPGPWHTQEPRPRGVSRGGNGPPANESSPPIQARIGRNEVRPPRPSPPPVARPPRPRPGFEQYTLARIYLDRGWS